MLVLTLYAALAASSGSETLYEASATFWEDLPIAELSVQGHGTLRFLVDSGSNRSVLFPSSGGGSQTTLELSARGGKIGRCEFRQVARGKMTADGARLMNRLGIAGALGDDFLRTHDVLINYGHKEICFSGALKPGLAETNPTMLLISGLRDNTWGMKIDRRSIRSADLVEQEERYFIPATIEPQTACLMALDTGTGESALPMDLASGLKKTGVSKLVAGFQGRTERALEHIAKITAGNFPPMEVKVLASDQRGPILGSNAFEGRCLFLQLRVSKALSW